MKSSHESDKAILHRAIFAALPQDDMRLARAFFTLALERHGAQKLHGYIADMQADIAQGKKLVLPSEFTWLMHDAFKAVENEVPGSLHVNYKRRNFLRAGAGFAAVALEALTDTGISRINLDKSAVTEQIANAAAKHPASGSPPADPWQKLHKAEHIAAHLVKNASLTATTFAAALSFLYARHKLQRGLKPPNHAAFYLETQRMIDSMEPVLQQIMDHYQREKDVSAHIGRF